MPGWAATVKESPPTASTAGLPGAETGPCSVFLGGTEDWPTRRVTESVM